MEIQGTPGKDTLNGTEMDDTIEGGANDDVISAGAGNDEVDAGPDDDEVRGGPGTNILFGGNGEDTLFYTGPEEGDMVEEGVSLSNDLVFNLLPGTDSSDPFFTSSQIAEYVMLSEGSIAGGGTVKDYVFGFEEVTLSDQADYLEVRTEDDVEFLTDGLTINFDPEGDEDSGEGGGSIDDELVFGQEAGSLFGDYGVFYRDGYVQLGDQERTETYFKLRSEGARVPAEINDAFADEDNSVGEAGLYFTGVDNVELTDLDDRFAITSEDTGTHSGNGEILAKGGRDVISISQIEPGDLTVDGGADDDIIIVSGGEGVVTAGGVGRDFIINTTPGGEIYGDVVTGLTFGPDGVDGVADTSENGDFIWFAPDTTIFDPQHDDVLSFYGVPLTGGDASATSMGLLVGDFPVISTAFSIVQSNLALYAALNLQSVAGLLRTSFDTFLLNIAYILEGSGNDITMRVVNRTDLLFKIGTGNFIEDEIDFGDGTEGFSGGQTVLHFDAETADIFGVGEGLDVFAEFGGYGSFMQSLVNETGDFGMHFNFPSVFFSDHGCWQWDGQGNHQANPRALAP